jgi:hypothetical protein
MQVRNTLPVCFFASFILSLAGSFFRVRQIGGANILLALGVVLSLVFIILAIYEVRTSRRISTASKNIWTLALILFSSIAGLVYVVAGRKHVTSKRQRVR